MRNRHPLILFSTIILLAVTGLNGGLLWAQSVRYYSINLFDGMDGSSYGFQETTFAKAQAVAKKVSLDLEEYLDEECIYKQHGANFFLIFYDLIETQGCPREYIVQRTVLEKQWIGGQYANPRTKREYLVEVMKIDQNGQIMRADEHYMMYTLQGAQTRFMRATLEAGCGQIPGVVQGNAWPFGDGIDYKRIQNYSTASEQFYQVQFDYSRRYHYSFEYSLRGTPKVHIPGYACINAGPVVSTE